MEGTIVNSLENPVMKTDSIKIDSIKVDDSSPLFNRRAMFYKEFPSDLRQINFFSNVIMQKVPESIKGKHLLERQIRELLKNAIKHGNKSDRTKKIKIYYAFTPEEAHIIIEDEGEGFREIEEWNDFYKKRCECYIHQRFDEMDKYKSFKTIKSTTEDNGSALCDAVKFWNEGIVFTSKRNTVAVLKKYPQKMHGITIK